MSESDLKDLKSEIFKYKGRKFKRQHQPPGLLAPNKDNVPLHQSAHYPSTNTTPSRSIILPPPQPLSSNKKRPISAKGRPRPQSMGSTQSLKPPDQYRLQFALQHYQPLPPITDSEPQPTPDYSPLSNKHQLYDVDSAVDLEYSSQCGTPIDLPPNYPVSYSYAHSMSYSSDNVASSPHMTGSPRLAILKSLCPKTSPKSHVRSASPHLQPHSPNLSHLHTTNLQVDSVTDKPQPPFRQYESESSLKYVKESSTPTKRRHSLPDHHNTVQLGLKLPNGDRIQADFPLTATLEDIRHHVESCASTDLHDCIITTNEVPRKVFNDESQTLYESGITVRTVLYFSLP